MKKLLEQDDNLYSTKLKVSFDIAEEEEFIEHDTNVDVQYQIDIEYRSWGIKDMTMSFPKPVSISYFVENVDKDKYREIEIDLSKAEVNWVKGKSMLPTELDVRISKDGMVLSSEITAYYIGLE